MSSGVEDEGDVEGVVRQPPGDTVLWTLFGFGQRSRRRAPAAQAQDPKRQPQRVFDRPPGRAIDPRGAPPFSGPHPIRRPGERPRPQSPLRDIAQRRRRARSMEFVAGFAAGAGLLLSLATAVYILFPTLWPAPVRTSARPAPAAIASMPAAVPPGPALLDQQAPAARGDSEPLTPNETASTAPPPPPPGLVKTVIAKADAPKPVAVAATTGTPPPAPAARVAEAAAEQAPLAQASLKGAYAVYLSSFPDRELAESGWMILAKRYAKGLQGLKPQIIEARRGGQKVYRLFAGPLQSRGDAEDRCRLLSYGTMNCKPADFTGGVDPATSLAWEG